MAGTFSNKKKVPAFLLFFPIVFLFSKFQNQTCETTVSIEIPVAGQLYPGSFPQFNWYLTAIYEKPERCTRCTKIQLNRNQ